jgi:MFS family permease
MFFRDEALLIAASSIGGVLWGMNQVVLSLYLYSLGLSPARVGLLITAQTFIGAALSLILSALGDAYGRVKFVVLNRAISAAGLAVLASGNPYGVLLLTFMSGGALVSALMAEKAADLDRDMSVSSAANTALSVVGSIIAGVLTLRGSIIAEIPIVAASAALVAAVRESYRGTGEISFKIESFPKVARLSINALIGMGAGILLPMLSLWFYLRFGVNQAELGPVFAASNAALALATLAAPRLSRLWGRARAIVYTQSLGVLFLVLMPLVPTYSAAAAIYIARNAAMNMATPLFSSFVAGLIPEHERARGYAMIGFLDALPRAVGPSISGYLYGLGMLSLPFYITASLYAAATVGFYCFFGRGSA